jgi:hypothetical protein
MYDDPELTQLLKSVKEHLEVNVIPAIRADPKLYFQTLVAINVLNISERELAHQQNHACSEWERLNQLEKVHDPLPTSLDELKRAIKKRNANLAQAIRRGDYDQRTHELTSYLKQVVIEKLEVANPRYLKRVMLENQ